MCAAEPGSLRGRSLTQISLTAMGRGRSSRSCGLLTRLQNALGFSRACRTTDTNINLIETPMSKVEGKKSVRKVVTKVVAKLHRKILWPEATPESLGAPQFESLGLSCGWSGRVSAVMPGSPAARAGVKVFDRVIEVDGAPLNGAEERRMVVEACKFLQTPLLRIERPSKAMWSALLPEVVDEAGVDSTFVSAIVGVVTDDAEEVMACVHEMAMRGEHLIQRRITAEEAQVAHLTALVRGAEAGSSSGISHGGLLIEIALDGGHREAASLLLSLVDVPASTPTPSAAPGHVRSDSSSSGGSSSGGGGSGGSGRSGGSGSGKRRV